MRFQLPLRQFISPRRGFSLVEVLLAILILGIGVVSIAALFPAGIAQQRLANDDVMGPIVANSAISIIRSKVRQEDFGTFEEYQQFFYAPFHDSNVPQAFFSRTLAGDWDWMRPGFLLSNDGSTGNMTSGFYEPGAIDIFSYRYTWQVGWNNWTGPEEIDTVTEFPDGWPGPAYWPAMGGGGNDHVLYGIPYNTSLYVDNNGNLDPPNFIISQRERYYPMQSSLANNDDAARPQYVWDCMFRRYQGRVYVAIFVYRVSSNNTAAAFVVPSDGSDYPPMPFWLDLTSGTPPYNSGVRDVWYDANGRARSSVLGSENVASLGDLDPEAPEEAWQRTRQWLLDQNNNVHRVVGVEHVANEGGFLNVIRVELTRPLQPVMMSWGRNATIDNAGWGPPFNNVLVPSDAPSYYFADPQNDNTIDPNLQWYHFDRGVLTDLWYIPRNVTVTDPGGVEVEFTLTPVFLTVKEL